MSTENGAKELENPIEGLLLSDVFSFRSSMCIDISRSASSC